MIRLEDLYFEWLLNYLDDDGVTEGVAYLCGLLHNCEFHRRVGNDINRAVDGADLRKEFLSQFSRNLIDSEEAEVLLMRECSWLEMLIALARRLSFAYDRGVDYHFYGMLNNMGLWYLTDFTPRRLRSAQELDQHVVSNVTSAIDQNQIKSNGFGGMFPLHKRHDKDQRRVEIWDQCAAYFRERLEGVLWTSTM